MFSKFKVTEIYVWWMIFAKNLHPDRKNIYLE